MKKENKVIVGLLIILIIGGASAKTGNTIIGDSISNLANITAEYGFFDHLYLNGAEVTNPSYQYPLVLVGGSPTYTLTVTPSFNKLYVKEIQRNHTGDGIYNDAITPTIFADLYGWRIEVNNSDTFPYIYTSIKIVNGTIDINGTDVNINGNINLNGENINNTLQKSRQMAFEVNLNTTSLVANDNVLIPYDFYLTNISTLLDNNTGYLNYSISKYSSYPSGKAEIITINTSSYLNRTFMNNIILNRDDVVELNYTEHQIIESAVILFELQRI